MGTAANPHPSAPPERREAVSAALLGFLSEGFCEGCGILLEARIQALVSSGVLDGIHLDRLKLIDSSRPDSAARPSSPEPMASGQSETSSSGWGSAARKLTNSATARTINAPLSVSSRGGSGSQITVGHGDEEEVSSSSAPCIAANASGAVGERGLGLSPEEEWRRLGEVGRKKDYVLFDNVKGRRVNVLQGLELHTRVFDAKEQEMIVKFVYRLQKLGKERKLRERTYTEPSKWMRGKGRVTLQFGCCYNYAVDKDGNPPGILRDEEVDPLPPLFKQMIRRMVRWRVLPPSCVPNSCIVNIYDQGDCIPPHIDHHDFLRPFCTVSFLAECNILFGQNIKVVGPGEFAAPIAIPLPVGSVFILSGNGADVAKHCVPGVPAKRISITFRKMDEAKLPYSYAPEHELQGLQPLTRPQTKQLLHPEQDEQQCSPPPLQHQPAENQRQEQRRPADDVTVAAGGRRSSNTVNGGASAFQEADFPPLGGGAGSTSSAGKRVGVNLRRKPIRQ